VNEVTDLHEPQDTGPDPFSSDPNAFQDSATDGAPANSLGEKAANRLSSNEIIAGNEAGGFDTEDPDELGAQAAEAFDSNTIDTIGTEAANELGEADEIDSNPSGRFESAEFGSESDSGFQTGNDAHNEALGASVAEEPATADDFESNLKTETESGAANHLDSAAENVSEAADTNGSAGFEANALENKDRADEPNVYKEQQIQKEAGESLNNEFAAEVAAPPAAAENPKLDREANRKQDDIDVDATETGGRMVGWLALALSILSLFAYPVLLGTTGVILGIVAYAQGRRALGVWSILIGGLSLLSYFVLVPFYT
jgi:hypothetical protein